MIRRLFLAVVVLLVLGCARVHQPDVLTGTLPRIWPDYTHLVLPCNIAPLNFIVREAGSRCQVEVGTHGQVSFAVTSPDSIVRLPEAPWQELLAAATNDTVFVRVSVERDGLWHQYSDIRHYVSPFPIDPVLSYRLLYPGYEFWNEMGIYQRDLTGFGETCLLENRRTGGQCMNCHSFAAKSPETLMLHVRGKNGGTLLLKDGKISKVQPKPAGHSRSATYPYWSDDGRHIVFFSNEVNQGFHTAGPQMIEVYDKASDLFVYEVESGTSFTDSLVYGDDYLETFPTFTPDGRQIYFCRARRSSPGLPVDSVRYGLYRVDFDAVRHTFSGLECVIDAPAHQRSISFPRVSPDGRWLVYTQSAYGTFSIWHPESDLWLLDLQTGRCRSLDEVNSPHVDSYHSWSSDGHWLVFSSKREDGLWARPYICFFHPATGEAGKPFLLPQRDPDHYNRCTFTYNLPELVKGTVKEERRLERMLEQ